MLKRGTRKSMPMRQKFCKFEPGLRLAPNIEMGGEGGALWSTYRTLLRRPLKTSVRFFLQNIVDLPTNTFPLLVFSRPLRAAAVAILKRCHFAQLGHLDGP